MAPSLGERWEYSWRTSRRGWRTRFAFAVGGAALAFILIIAIWGDTDGAVKTLVGALAVSLTALFAPVEAVATFGAVSVQGMSIWVERFVLEGYADVSVRIGGRGNAYTAYDMVADVKRLPSSTDGGTIRLLVDGQSLSNLAISPAVTGVSRDLTGSESFLIGDVSRLRCELIAGNQVVAADERILSLPSFDNHG